MLSWAVTSERVFGRLGGYEKSVEWVLVAFGSRFRGALLTTSLPMAGGESLVWKQWIWRRCLERQQLGGLEC